VVSRLEVLENECAIAKRLAAYCRAADYGDVAGFVDCFTPDGVYECRGNVAFRIEGHQAIRDFFQEFTSEVDPEPDLTFSRHKHFVLDTTFDHDGDSVRCESYFLVVQEIDLLPAIRLFGRYHDCLVTDGQRNWRFKERIIDVESMRPGAPRLRYQQHKIDNASA
jgi:hypothetical protein